MPNTKPAMAKSKKIIESEELFIGLSRYAQKPITKQRQQRAQQ
jgi:hypothetical protein